VRVVLFAALRELAGASSVELEEPPATVGALLEQLGERFGDRFSGIVRAGSVIVNGEAVGRDTPIRTQDEVALLPPVSGG
jgi:MoaD family protein